MHKSLAKCKLKMLLWKSGEEKAYSDVAVGLSAECLGGNARRPVVATHYSRHDVVGSPDVQGIPRFLRTASVEYISRPVAQAGIVRNHSSGTGSVRWAKADLPAHAQGDGPRASVDGNGAMGGQARENSKPTAHPADAEGQEEIHRADPSALAQANSAMKTSSGLELQRTN